MNILKLYLPEGKKNKAKPSNKYYMYYIYISVRVRTCQDMARGHGQPLQSTTKKKEGGSREKGSRELRNKYNGSTPGKG